MAAPSNGTIKRLVSEKGFGFVAASDGSEYFFHQSACNGCQFDSLREGQAVTFEKVRAEGPRAETFARVSVIGASAFRRKHTNKKGSG